MVKSCLPTSCREISPDRVSSPSSMLSIPSRASTNNNCSTRECSLENRLEITTTPSPSPLSSYSTIKTPIPPDSPLLTQPSNNKSTKSMPSYAKTVRIAKNYKAGRKKIDKKVGESVLDLRGEEVTFLIERSRSGRVGWKIMPEDEELNLRMNYSCLREVMDRIRDMQFSGEVIPSRISVVMK
eukprot:GFUD01072163.1.p1 GENE.GFUD01072163.1~~GFUD01072163.1.p1  ORF type:complete len:183 (+),score=50.73 GFUD01072163.1:68-616(+)